MVNIRLQRQQGKAMLLAAGLKGGLRCRLYVSRQDSTAALRNPHEVIGNLVMAPARFTGVQGIVHVRYNSIMSSPASTVVRVHIFPSLPRKTLAIISAGRAQASQVWNACRDLHAQARKEGAPWPNRDALQKATKGRFALHSQSVQMICHAFLANVDTTSRLRAKGNRKARYPWRDKRYYPLLWPEQAVAVQGSSIILPMGRGRASVVLPKPDGFRPGGCKLVWNGSANELHVAVEIQHAQNAVGDRKATIDLGQIHQCAVTTDDGHALIVSGRGQRSLKRLKNRMHGQIAKKQSRCKKGSRRHKRLARSRRKHAGRMDRQIKDLAHKGTRAATDFMIQHRVGEVFIGDPHGVRKKSSGRKHNQRMAQWEYGRDKDYLAQKLGRAGIASFAGSERGTSSRCPQCGHKHKPKGRVWLCKKCGFQGHRDLVGSVNMHEDNFKKLTAFPSLQDVTYLRPGLISLRQADEMNIHRMGSSSRPDTGLGEPNRRHETPELLLQPQERTSDKGRASQEAGHLLRYSTEAHPL